VLLDVKLNRVHAGVTFGREADARTQKQIVERPDQSAWPGSPRLLPVRPRILGGVGRTRRRWIFDGSVRRRLAALQRRMLTGD